MSSMHTADLSTASAPDDVPTPDSSSGAVRIAVHGLTKRYGDAAAVDGIDVEVPAGSFLVLLGPSGCGKTTTLRMLAGLETPTAGRIVFGEQTVVDISRGVSLPPGRRNAGLVFQSYALWPHMTVAANIGWPLKVAKWSSARRAARVEEVLALLDISALGARYPGEISGGQQQRVAIARTIGPGPGVLLFDEPLSNLDAKLRVETRGELLRIHRKTGATSVYVTHDQVEAMTMATHVALMRDGRIEQFGPPRQLLDEPATAFVATFMGTPPANVLDAEVRDRALVRDGVVLGAGGGLPDGTDVRLMYRPQDVALAERPGPRQLTVQFADATPLAGRWVISGMCGATRLSLTSEVAPDLRLGDGFLAQFPEQPAAVFRHDGHRLPAAPSAPAA